MNTRRAGSRSGCASNQACRLKATSGLSCSAACAAFFERDPVANQEAMHRADRKRSAMVTVQKGRELGQRDVLLRLDRTHNHVSEHFDVMRPQIPTFWAAQIKFRWFGTP